MLLRQPPAISMIFRITGSLTYCELSTYAKRPNPQDTNSVPKNPCGLVIHSILNVTSPWAVLRFIVLIIALYFIFKLATHNRIGRALSRKIEEKLRVRFKIQKRTVGRILDLGEDFGVVGIALHKDSPFIGKTLAASELSKRKILVLAIERENKRIFEPRGNHKLHPGDNLICYGNFADMKALS